MGTPHELEWTAQAPIPILPLLSTVVYPEMVQQVVITKPRNLALLQKEGFETPIGCAIQVNPDAVEAGPGDLAKRGVIARVLNHLNLPGGPIQLVLMGIARMEIVSFVQTEPYLKAVVRVLEPEPASGPALDREVASVVELFKGVVAGDENLPDELANIVMANLGDPGKLADFVVETLEFSIPDRQRVLETVDVGERLRIVAQLLQDRVRQLAVASEMRQQTAARMTRAQREYFLRRELEEIQTELGEAGFGDEAARYEERLAALDLPEEARHGAETEVKRLRGMSHASAEYDVVKNYLDWMLDLPWSVETADNTDLRSAMAILEEDHHGLRAVKDRILEFLAVLKLRGSVRGPILCLSGPPGVGKTSLGQSIARALGRRFARISVGGVSDEAEIRGHRRTYIGSMPGRILQSLRRAGSRNPVVMIDELDKITSEGRGDPAAALLEVLDPEQNATFRDTYLGVPFDLSRVLFLATANVVEMIPDPLLDRLEVIALPGYIEEEKLHIATRYLLPRLRDAHGLQESHFSMTEDAIRRVVREYTLEAGVRELERQLATICRKVAKDVAMDFSCTFLVGPEEVLRFLGPSRVQIEMAGKTDRVGVATGLAWTAEGGDILFVEALRMPGGGDLRLTGQVGDVMRESAMAALSYIQAHAADWGIPDERIRTSTFHIHLPGGAIPKDGPSAGVAMVLVIVSVLTNRPIHHDVAMTGEITLRGEVLPIGGVREKVLGAHRAGIRKVLLPEKNRDDLVDIPPEILGKIEFRFVERVDEVLSEALLGVALPPGEESQGRGSRGKRDGSKVDGRRPRARAGRVPRSGSRKG